MNACLIGKKMIKLLLPFIYLEGNFKTQHESLDQMDLG